MHQSKNNYKVFKIILFNFFMGHLVMPQYMILLKIKINFQNIIDKTRKGWSRLNIESLKQTTKSEPQTDTTERKRSV